MIHGSARTVLPLHFSMTANDSRGGRTVHAVSGRPESLLLLLAVLAVVGSLASYVLLRPQKSGPPTPLSWQVRSFDGLGPVDQAIHGALLPAGEEIIWFNNDTGGWITLERAQTLLLPPFFRDAFWKTNGEVRWQLVLPGTHQAHDRAHDGKADAIEPAEAAAARKVTQGTQGTGAAVYQGFGGHAKGQSAYLLVIGHAHAGVMWANQATIWVHPDPNASYPGIVKPEALVGKGWRQVIPYDGASEVERVKGNS